MTLAQLLAGFGPEVPEALAPREVRGLALDSRRVRPGDLFFALRGQHESGARFAAEALSRGAIAVVAEEPIAGLEPLIAPAARRCLALAAGRFFDHPDRQLKLVGVTGTNGKTTTALLVASVVEAAGEPPGVIGTLGVRVAGPLRAGSLTTPEAPELFATFQEMARAGVRHCAMEVSSHALAQERVAGLSFAAAGFTNLTRDHLDFHGDLESYFQAKRRLFTELMAPKSRAVVNVDGGFGERLAKELLVRGTQVTRLGRKPGVTLRIAVEKLSLAGIELTLQGPEETLAVRSSLIGAHNSENLALAAGLCLALEFPPAQVASGLSALATVPGRLERVQPSGEGPPRALGFVDYAHTDDALRRVLLALRQVGTVGERRLIAVFGCGGDRDPGKRELMGTVAALGADVVVATSDNPRSEDPRAILAPISKGLIAGGKTELTASAAREGGHGYLVEPDRRAAIALAVALAGPQDVVLVAGKGHETSQIVGTQKLPFDDRVELRRALEQATA